MPESRHLIDVLKHGATEVRQHFIVGNQVRAMQRHARFHTRVRVRQLSAEVQTLLPRLCQYGRPDVNSPPSGNQPRHAGPPSVIAYRALVASGSAKN